LNIFSLTYTWLEIAGPYRASNIKGGKMNSTTRTALAFCLFSITSPFYTRLVAEETKQPNPDSALIDQFNNRIADYMKIHNAAKAKLPVLKPTDSAAVIASHEREFARLIRELRPQAAQGSIFTPEITEYFRRRIHVAMEGPQKARIKQSLANAEPVKVPLRVNDTYPDGVPLQSTPPTLLLNLPKLPKELEYRVVGHSLVLRDVDANLIVDFARNVIP
jgi:hypothetical protein